jgi:transcriptional regulator with XRE-family HTH domain
MNGFHQYRKRRGLTQKQVAEALGVDRSTISRAERLGDASASLMRRARDWSGGELTLDDFARPLKKRAA